MRRDALLELFEENKASGYGTSGHMETLRSLAVEAAAFADPNGIVPVVEFGVAGGRSTSALILGATQNGQARERVISYDIVESRKARRLRDLAGDAWRFVHEDTREASRIPECAMLFVDSLHTYAQVRAELAHAGRVWKFLVFHDTITFGSVGADGETGQPLAGSLGIRPAIDELMIRDPTWKIRFHHTHSHGLLCLVRA